GRGGGQAGCGESPGESAKEALQGGDAARSEREVREPPHPDVRWRITVRQRWNGPEAALGQQAARGRADRLERREGVGRGEQLGCSEDLFDVDVARDDPVAEIGTVEDWGGGACRRKEGGRVGKVRIRKRIEPLGETPCIAACRSADLASFTAIDHFP